MEMENTISLTELLAALIRKWKGICVPLLVFALMLGGYQTYRQISLANAPENTPEKIEERYQIALKDYETQKESLQKTLKDQEKSLKSKEEYLEKSILLQVDPYNEYWANIVFAVTDIDDSAQLYRYPNTSADYLPKKIVNQYMELWGSMDVPKDIGIAKYADVEWKYLSEVINVYNRESEMVSIQAVGATASDAEMLVEAVYDYFETHQSVIAASSAQHSFAVVNKSTKNVIDESLETKREDLETEIENLKTGIVDSEKAIKDLEEPEREEGYSKLAIIKAVVKYAIFGAVTGTFLACLLICCWSIFANRAISSFQLERTIGVPFLGSLRIPRSFAESLAVSVMGERSWKDAEQAVAYISQQARAIFPKDGTILLLSTLPEKLACKGMGELAAVLSKDGYNIVHAMDAVHNPKAVESLQVCTGVVFLEMIEKSHIRSIRNSVLQAENAKKSVLGIITL